MTAPGLDLLLDGARLSGLVSAPVRATRLRPKPGVSTVAALVTDDGRPWGWVRVLEGRARAKAAKARTHAATVDREDAVGEAELPGAAALVQWGPIGTDPRLGRYAARAHLGAEATVLRHNPLRRLIVRDGAVVHRITAQPHRRRLTGLADALADVGVPVVAPVQVPGVRSSRISTWPWVEGGDASGATDPALLREIGVALAHLHAAGPALTPDQVEAWLPGRTWADLLGAAVVAVEQLTLAAVPSVERRARAVLASLRTAAPAAGTSVPSHGDFSADQCLLREDDRPLLTDLDRAAMAPPELDLASFLATSFVAGHRDVRPFLEGYADAAGLSSVPSVPAAWVAAALLQRVGEPWRAQRDAWVEETARIVELAETLLRDASVAAVVPEVVGDGTDRLTVDRAWPGKVRDGIPRVTVEGHDAAGRLRAGTWDRTGLTRLLPPGTDPALPALEAAAARGQLVVHRAGRRAVVRGPDAYVKVVRPGRGAALARAGEAGRRLATAAGLDAPRVLTAQDDVVEFSIVAGRPLHELSAGPDWALAWERWAEAWTRLQSADVSVGDLPAHGDADEAEVLRGWAARAGDLLGGTDWPARMERVAAELTARGIAEQPRLVPTHRDLHDKQLLWDGMRLAVLDLDTACLAHASLDPANLAAHASLREAQGLWSARSAELVRARARGVAAAAGVDEQRWRLAERATVVRLAAVYAFRPRWRRTVLDWAETAWASTADENGLIGVSSASPEHAAGWRV